MKRCFALLLCLLCLMGCAAAEVPVFDPYPQVKEELEALGFVISDDIHTAACQHYAQLQKFSFSIAGQAYNTKEEFAYILLMNLGMGTYDYETWVWTPTSHQIYVLDAEVLDVSRMYTEFLQGVQAIVDDAVFADVTEDLSGMTLEWKPDGSDGYRTVSFTCNGSAYTKRLTSYGDWLNIDIIDYVNMVLNKEGCRGQLHHISDDYDQMVFLFYGSADDAAALRRMIGTAATEEPTGLLDWLMELF